MNHLGEGIFLKHFSNKFLLDALCSFPLPGGSGAVIVSLLEAMQCKAGGLLPFSDAYLEFSFFTSDHVSCPCIF